MSRLRLLVAITSVLLGLAAAPAMAAPIAGVPVNASLLFTLDAQGGTLKPSADGSITLTLRGAARNVTWFTDRPDRNAGSITTERLQGEWSGFGFDAIPPNAALVLESAPRHRDTLALELRSIRYDAKRRTVTFSARRLNSLGGGLSGLDAQLDRRVAQHFATATLFIDNASPGASGGCTLGQPQLTATTKPILDMLPADGRLLNTREYYGLVGLLWTNYGGNGNDTFGLPTLTAPAAGTAWNICTSGRYPDYADDIGPCTVGEVDLIVTPGAWMRAGDGHWLPADGRTLKPQDAQLYAYYYGTTTLPKLTAADPNMTWMVCVKPKDTDDPAVGQLDLFVAPPKGVSEGTWLPADGGTVKVDDNAMLDAVINGLDTYEGRRKQFTLPDVPSPAPGLRYYVAAKGFWVLDR